MSNIQFISVSPEELANMINEGIKPLFENLNNSPKEAEKEFLSRKETASYLSISLPCLHDWANKGIITPYKMGGRTYFRYSEIVETLLKSNNAE